MPPSVPSVFSDANGTAFLVAKLIETAEPATKVGLSTFNALHDVLVKAPLYKRAIDGTASTISLAASTTAYK